MEGKILIIDDEPDILQFLNGLLTQEGYYVKSMSEGAKAIALLKSETFDIVITDIKMPDIDGLEIIKQVKQLNDETEVIVITGFATVNNAVRSLKANGAFDYLTKPLENIDELLNSIRHALDKRILKIKNKELLKKLKKEIEAHKKTAKQIQKSKIILQSVVDGISELLFMLDKNFFVRMLNKSTAEYFQIGFQKAVKKPCYHIFRGRSVPCENCRILPNILTGDHLIFERKSLKDDNRVEQVDIYPFKKREIEFAIVRITDITEKKRVQEQLIRSDRLSSLGRLSGGIAHEIRNPLAGINLFIDILRDKEKFVYTDKAQDILNEMKEGVNKIEGIVKRVLDFARPSKVSIDKIEMNTLITETIELWDENLRKSNIKRKLSLAKDLPPVLGDNISLQQVINNLVLNAVEAMKKDGMLEITSSKGISSFFKEREIIIITVEDTGPGIEPKYMEKIFNPFFTLKATGTGLGLSIVHQIIKQHGGFISFKCGPCKGTTFTIELPIMKKASDST